MANEKLITLGNLQEFKSKYDNALGTGQIVPSKSLTAKELETVSQESGDTQETPFIMQGTGTANGTSSVDTGTVGKHIQKQGSVYCVNQGFYSTKAGETINGVTFTNNGDGSWTADGTATGGAARFDFSVPTGYDFPLFVGHKFLVYSIKDVNTDGVTALGDLNGRLYPANSGGYNICTNNATSGNFRPYFRVPEGKTVNNVKIRPIIVDLTQWFGSNANIPQDLLDNPSHWYWYQNYGDYIAYNTGSLEASNGRYLVCGGRNVWDEEWEAYGDSKIINKNNISVIPNQEYYCRYPQSGYGMKVEYFDANNNSLGQSNWLQNSIFTTPVNCSYIKFVTNSAYGNIYKNDITISLYYAGEDYSQYYPYEQPKVYDTGTEQLLSTGVKLNASGEREDIYDYKEPDGTITRRVGSVDLGTLNYTLSASGLFFTSDLQVQGVIKPATSGYVKANVSSIYTVIPGNELYGPQGTNPSPDMMMAVNTSGGIYFNNLSYTTTSAFKTAMSGVYLYYELATPTTEQGTPFSENIEINDFGDMSWYSAYTDSNTNTLVSVPQGCKIFYPAWYVGFIDTLGNREDVDWNANKLVAKGSLSTGDPDTLKGAITLSEQLYTIMQQNIGGALRHQLASANSLDFLNTSWVDLGTLDWSTYSSPSSSIFRIALSSANIKPAADNSNNGNILASIYKVKDYTSISSSDNMCIAISNSSQNRLTLINTSYTDVTAFKVAMKGILLAYEKAS